jgi:NADH dehydrogenase/NADH:ubiquinone oxidoreductase subunit G
VQNVTIDDKTVTVREGTTILEAATKAGIWIPTLCYNQTMTPAAACRLCMVELVQGDRSKLVTSCNFPVRKDLTVKVNSERAEKARKGIMELLLARSPESLELKELAERMGVHGTPYPTVTESQRNCILCGLCVEVCDEVMECSAIGFAERGVDRTVTTPFRLATDSCIACGACAVVCPVGTIQVRIHEDTGEAEISPFKSRAKLLTCEGCGERMVTVPVGNAAMKRVNIDWEEFKARARLCPECRRKRSAASLAVIARGRAGDLRKADKKQNIFEIVK